MKFSTICVRHKKKNKNKKKTVIKTKKVCSVMLHQEDLTNLSWCHNNKYSHNQFSL